MSFLKELFLKMEKTQILFKEHFKIYVLLKNKFIFENELKKQNIEYYCDWYNQIEFEEGIRYYIQTTDRDNI